MGEFIMRKCVYLSIIGLIAAELLIFSGYVFQGLGMHLLNILAIIFIVVFYGKNLEAFNILQGLTLVMLLRVVNMAMPQFFTDILVQYPLIYGIMFIPIYYTVKNIQVPFKELGVNFNKFYIYLPVAILIGIVMSIVEYKILNSEALINTLSASNIALISIIMVMFIGLAEGLIFFSILQTRLEKSFGLRYGILIIGVVFGIMHSTYGSVNEILFATIFGIILAYAFQNTRSLPFTVVILGTVNIMLFGILPLTRWFI